MLDNTSDQPLYLQLKQILLTKIENMEWENGELPSEPKLCMEHGVSRITVRRALTELQNEGKIYRKQGKGTYVKMGRMEQKLPHFYSFTDEFIKRGWVPSTKVVEFDRIVPDRQIQQNLNIDGEDQVFRFTRLRYANNVLMAVETSWLPEKYFPGMTREMLEVRPLYDIMRDDYKIFPVSAKQWLSASIVHKDNSNFFLASKDIAVIDMERFASDGDKVIEYTHALARGDKFRFQVDLMSVQE